MSSFFTQLNDLEQQQRQQLKQPEVSQVAQNIKQEIEQVSRRSSKGLSKGLSNRLSKPLSICITAEQVEIMAFETCRAPKSKVNTEIPIDMTITSCAYLACQLEFGRPTFETEPDKHQRQSPLAVLNPPYSPLSAALAARYPYQPKAPKFAIPQCDSPVSIVGALSFASLLINYIDGEGE